MPPERDRLTIIDMLDALEAGISRIRASNGNHAIPPSESKPDAARAGALRARMEKTGVTSFEFTRIFGVPAGSVENWISGADAIPMWVEAGVQMLAMIPPSARRRLRENGTSWRPGSNPARRTHPFARIEEL